MSRGYGAVDGVTALEIARHVGVDFRQGTAVARPREADLDFVRGHGQSLVTTVAKVW
jgi:hypothetical protein